jgi:hypothetical protein
MEPRNRCQGINSASLCSLAGRYDNPIPSRCLAPIEFLKIPAQNRKLKSRYGARNRFQEPSLELSSGPVRQPFAYLVPSPHSGTKVTDTVLAVYGPYDLIGPVCNAFDAGNIHDELKWKGSGNRYFFGPCEMASSR